MIPHYLLLCFLFDCDTTGGRNDILCVLIDGGSYGLVMLTDFNRKNNLVNN